MPASVTLATGCDALAHLLEGFLNVGADNNHPAANQWALRGIRLVRENLSAALKNEPGARKAMAIAAALGGMTIRFKSTGLPHLCSFSWFGRIEHGIAAIMLLPESWRYYLGNPAVAERTRLLKEIFPGTTPEAVIDSFRSFLTSLGVPEKLKAFPGLTPELMELTAASAGENKMKLELAPRRVPMEESKLILQDILLKTYGE
jgi:alcohol dehydrogenase class IV